MKFKIKERVMLQNLIAGLMKENDAFTIRILRDLHDRMGFTEKEHKDFNLKIEDGRYFWKPEDDKEVEIKVGEIATREITRKLKELDKQKKMSIDLLDIYDKFIEKEE